MPAEPAEPAGPWRRLHPITILRELLGVAWNLVVAVIVLGALQGDALERFELLVPLVFFGVAIGRYYSTRYLITPEAVLWRRGILFRRHVEVPRSRIQNVSSGADVLGRIFGLRTVTISTAGSEGEVELALVSSQEASFLMADLLGTAAGPGAVPAGSPAPGGPAAGPGAGAQPPPPPDGAVPAEVAAPPPDGAVPARAAPPPSGTAGAPAGAATGGAPPPPGAQPWSVPPPPTVRRLATLPTQDLLIYAATGGGLVVLLVAVAVSVAASIGTGSPRPLLVLLLAGAAPVMGTLDLADFELTGEADRVRVRHGLLKTRDKWARRERIQVLTVDRPVLRSALGYETVSVATADASVGGDSDLSLCSPLGRRGRWPELAAELLERPSVGEGDLRPVSPLAVRRRVVRLAPAAVVLAAPVGVVVGVVVGPWVGIGAGVATLVAGLAAALALARRAQRLDGYAADDDHLLVRRGMLGSRLWLVRRTKVQAALLVATPFQRRLGLVSVHLDTANVAGGRVVVPDLPRDRAEELAADLVARADEVYLPDGV